MSSLTNRTIGVALWVWGWAMSGLDRVVGCGEDGGLAGVDLPGNALDDPVTLARIHDAFQRGNADRGLDNAVGGLGDQGRVGQSCPGEQGGVILTVELHGLDDDRFFAELGHGHLMAVVTLKP